MCAQLAARLRQLETTDEAPVCSHSPHANSSQGDELKSAAGSNESMPITVQLSSDMHTISDGQHSPTKQSGVQQSADTVQRQQSSVFKLDI
jgi:hypothetical protein